MKRKTKKETKILAVETSCDETAVSIIEASGTLRRPQFKVLTHLVSSQTQIHAPWGGVVPMLAKREHVKNLVPLLHQALQTARLLEEHKKKTFLTLETAAKIKNVLERDPDLLDAFLLRLPKIKPPAIDAIGVTEGPGLEPALWVGLNFARALSVIWEKPILPINHLEGHIVSVILEKSGEKETVATRPVRFPAVALIASGGHTELVLVKDWLDYEVLGATRDDAAGEAFDKVARILGLPYPGGPAIADLAKKAEDYKLKAKSFSLPRPMLNSPDFDFSFAGLKTAVLYLVKKLPELTGIIRADIAAEFQQAVIEVLVNKALKAVRQYNPQTLIVSGGVAANQRLREVFQETLAAHGLKINLRFPEIIFATDNATMIALAAYFHLLKKVKKQITGAKGNLRLGQNS